MKLKQAAFIIGSLGGRPPNYVPRSNNWVYKKIRASGTAHEAALLLEDGVFFLLLEDSSSLLLLE